ncbi:MAG: creatininase family protein [Longimicrobiaceae bacterium]
MASSLRSCSLTDLSWVEVERHLEADRRLIVPVGECDQHGPHLPLGATSRITRALARDLSGEFGVLRAPLFPYGVNVPSQRLHPGAGELREKILHRALNDLLAGWERQGFDEFILLTAHGHGPHVEQAATVSVRQARVRAVDALAVDVSEFLPGCSWPQHGGEVVTSLLLYLCPEVVELESAVDFEVEPAGFRPFARSALPRLPASCPGSVGRPSRASPETGRAIYDYIHHKIRQTVFLAPEE